MKLLRSRFFVSFTAFFMLASLSPVAGAALFISEYVEGTSNNKALEIYNGSGAAVDLSGYAVKIYFNGNTLAGATVNLSGTLAGQGVFVLANSAAEAAILSVADMSSGALSFNGDDAVALSFGATLVDIVGQIGLDPGTEWGAGLVSTMDNTLRRKIGVLAGDANGADFFDPALEWDGFSSGTYVGLGTHQVAAIPEPSAYALLLAGLGLLGFVARRRRSPFVISESKKRRSE